MSSIKTDLKQAVSVLLWGNFKCAFDPALQAAAQITETCTGNDLQTIYLKHVGGLDLLTTNPAGAEIAQAPVIPRIEEEQPFLTVWARPRNSALRYARLQAVTPSTC